MQEPQLRYAGNDFIRSDFRRLKKIKSLEADIEEVFKVICGLVEEANWPPHVDFCGGLITELSIEDEIFRCFKDRVPTTNPPLTPSNGCRLIYAIGIESRTFIPLLVFRASEEGTMYKINSKQFKLTSSNFGKIIDEKLKD